MSEIFRPLIKSSEASQEPQSEAKPDDGSVAEVKRETPIEREIKDNLEFWETDSKKKYVNEYFDTHKIGQEFILKMPLAQIDKFIKNELEARKYEKTTVNYKKVLADIEEEIHSGPLELFERIRKINGYIRAFKRMRDAKQKLGAYKEDGMEL